MVLHTAKPMDPNFNFCNAQLTEIDRAVVVSTKNYRQYLTLFSDSANGRPTSQAMTVDYKSIPLGRDSKNPD